MTNKKIYIVLFGLLALLTMIVLSNNVKKISMFGFKGEYNSLKMIVDTEVARLRINENFIPLFIHLGHSENKVLRASRDSFTLINPDGQSVSMASYKEVVGNYGTNLLSNDYTQLEKVNDYASMDFLSCKRISKVAFFPNPSSNSIMYDNVEMPNRTYFRTLIYFPNNSKNKEGTYRLIFNDKESGLKVEVPFEIKWMKN